MSDADKRILMVVADRDFNDDEYRIPKSMFDDAHFEVTTASAGGGRARGMHGTWATVDMPLSACRADNYSAIVFVGGQGAKALWDDRSAIRLASDSVNMGKVVGAICLAPAILARARLLTDRLAIADQGALEELQSGGAVIARTRVAIDGRIVTADGPMAAMEFATSVIRALDGH